MRLRYSNKVYKITVFILGAGIIGLNQWILYLMGASIAVSVWSLSVTLALTGGLCYSLLRRSWGLKPLTKEEALTFEAETDEAGRNKIEQAEKLTLAGILAAGIAHEIRNPLTSLKGFLQLLSRKEPQYTGIMLAEVDRINQIVGELLELASPREPKLQHQMLQPLLHNVITLLQPQAAMYNIQLIGRYGKDTGALMVECNVNKLKQVFINLIKNAIEAMEDGGSIVISLAADGEFARVEIMDEGPGIPPELQVKLGAPFFTTKSYGTGLGLMVSRRIVHDHRGTLSFRNLPRRGTIVTVELPVFHETKDV